MRNICAAVVASLSLALNAVSQDRVLKPIVNDAPLTAAQVAIYRAVLEDYAKGSDGKLNVANRTEPLEQSGLVGFDKACAKGIQLQAGSKATSDIHKLDTSLTLDSRFLLVDPDQQEVTIRENDPQNLVKGVIDHGQEVSDKRLENSVKQAFKVGLFTLSEIAFDKQHHHAIVAYSFVCGEFCGHGNLLVLARAGQDWKIIRRCGGWVS